MEETRTLARLVAGLEFKELPKEVIEKTKLLVLDQIGCEIASSTLPWNRAVYQYVRDRKGGTEESTVVNYGLKTSAEDAVFANATFGHGFEMDDTDQIGIFHPGCVVVSTALALGEREMIDGKEFITAVALGYDVGMRIGAAARMAIRRWFHPTGILGPFAAATVAARILKLDQDKVLHALGIAGSQSSGLMEYAETGGSVKRLHAGIAAHGGMRAALLAERGLTGPTTVLEGKKGFCQAFSGEYSLQELTRDIGKEFRVMKMGFKPYACCGAHHAALDAISNIRAKQALSADRIRKITVGGNVVAFNIAGADSKPEDICGMQFSGRFGIALRIVKGDNQFSDYTEENLRNPELRALANRVEYVYDQELEDISSDTCPAKVVVEMLDGATLTDRVDYPKGTIQNPMSKEELETKFRGLASTVLPDKRVEQIVATVNDLERLDNVWGLSALLKA